MANDVPPRPAKDPDPTPVLAPGRLSASAPPAAARPPQTVAWLGTIAFLGIAGALFLGFTSVDDCGSPWSPDHTAADRANDVDGLTRAMTGRAQDTNNPHAACQEAFGSRSPIAITFLALGGAAGIAALAARNCEQTRTQPTVDTAPGPS